MKVLNGLSSVMFLMASEAHTWVDFRIVLLSIYFKGATLGVMFIIKPLEFDYNLIIYPAVSLVSFCISFCINTTCSVFVIPNYVACEIGDSEDMIISFFAEGKSNNALPMELSKVCNTTS